MFYILVCCPFLLLHISCALMCHFCCKFLCVLSILFQSQISIAEINFDCRFQVCFGIYDVALILFQFCGWLAFVLTLFGFQIRRLTASVCARARLWLRRNAGQPMEYPSSLVLIVSDLSCVN